MTMLSGLSSMFSQSAFQAVAAGLLTGAIVGSTVVASGILPLALEPEQPKLVALVACPGGGPELARVPAGQELLITGRSEDGSWLEVYLGQPGVDFAWVPAPALRAASTLDALPIRECDTSMTFLPTLGPPPTVIPPTAVPGTVIPTPELTLPPGVTASPAPPATPTARPTPTAKVTASPKPTPTKTATPPKTPTPTLEVTPEPTAEPPPPNNPPSISNLSRTQQCIDNGSSSQSVVTVTATDPDPNDTLTVRLRIGYRDSFNNQYYRLGSLAMTPVGGNQWSYTLSAALFQSYNWHTWPEDREVTFDVTARDNHGVDSATLFSHSSESTQLWYRPISGCTIF